MRVKPSYAKVETSKLTFGVILIELEIELSSMMLFIVIVIEMFTIKLDKLFFEISYG